ncbi:MAG: DNA alkylation repair protein [Bacteroidetes bacterium]|nr:DNA alkylation repair protein [Bacteroidota bacterium]
MEPLKELFNKAYYLILAKEVKSVFKNFNDKGFLNDVLKGIESRELNARLRHTSVTLNTYLPKNYRESISILKQVTPKFKNGYTNLIFPDYVALYGLDDFNFSLEALSYFTQFGSSEFAIRVFLKKDFSSTLKVMKAWAKNENVHIRRLASEGCRPRLPWSFKLDEVIKNPILTLPILESLKEDNELYVKKSVANHINDFSKEHPDLVLKILKNWKNNNSNTQWILKHGARTLLKQGNQKALQHFGVKENKQIELTSIKLKNKQIKIGDNLGFDFQITNNSLKTINIRVEYAIYFKISNNKHNKKVFKISERQINPKEKINFNKKHSFKPLSTRRYYEGTHFIAPIINGKEFEKQKFNCIFII